MTTTVRVQLAYEAEQAAEQAFNARLADVALAIRSGDNEEATAAANALTLAGEALEAARAAYGAAVRAEAAATGRPTNLTN